MRKLRRGRPAGLLAALGLGGCIAAASASQAAAFDPAPSEGPMGQPEPAGSLPPQLKIMTKQVLILHPQGGGLEGAGGSYGLPTARSRHLTEAMLDVPAGDATGPVRSFRYPGDDIIRVFSPPPPAVFAGGNLPGSPSLDAMLDDTDD